MVTTIEEGVHQNSTHDQWAAGEAPEVRLIDEARDMRRIVADALDFRPPSYVRSMFGSMGSWLLPHRPTSEFRIVSPWKLRRAVKYLIEVNVPSILRQPAGAGTGEIFLNPTEILLQPDPEGRNDSFLKETWLFINGIATNKAVAKMNAQCLAQLFRRPITVVHNATDSVGVDVLECAIGKGWELMSRPARKAYQVILEALENPDKERVIVVAHSQGTIIMANALRALCSNSFRQRLFEPPSATAEPAPEPWQRGPRLEHLAKLEVYAFANCADHMQHHPATAMKGVRVPWIESFGNEYDLVARLGMLAPRPERCGIKIEGSKYVERGKWGHMLNEHYLFGIEDALKAGCPGDAYAPVKDSPPLPRLYAYFDGQAPDPY